MPEYEAMTDREKDDWGAEHVMGWKKPLGGCVNSFCDDKGVGYYIGPEPRQYEPTTMSFHPSTYASSDYEILKKVRETWDADQTFCFGQSLYSIWEKRVRDHDGIYAILVEPGDYLHAAWLAKNGEQL